MARAKLTARTFPTHRRSASGPWASRRERSLIKQREEQCYRCSLIYKAARFMAVRRRRPLFLPPRPRRNRDIPSSDRAHSTSQPCKGFACARRLRIRFPGLPLRIEALRLRCGREIGITLCVMVGSLFLRRICCCIVSLTGPGASPGRGSRRRRSRP